MNVTFDMESAPEILYRVGRRPHVWEWRDWRTAFPDRTFHNRWDDPKGEYRVLYAASSRFGAYLEVLSWARPDLELLADCSCIEDNDPTAPRTMPPGRLPPGWRNNLIIGKGVSDEVHDPLVVVGSSASLAAVRLVLAREALQFGLKDIDAEVIRCGDRRFTQAVSRFIYEHAQSAPNSCAGISYLSRYGDDVWNCAIFEWDGKPFPVTHVWRRDIALEDSDFLAACGRLHIEPS